MKTHHPHPNDAELLLHAAGEASHETARHVAACSICQDRQQVLQSQLRDAAIAMRSATIRVPGRSLAWVTGVAVTALALSVGIFNRPFYSQTPNPALTPGAVRPEVTKAMVCSGNVPADLAAPRAMAVFQRYAISRPSPRTFELDYLIPPDLGGSDAPENLWPQPYANGEWNSKVKDALEDRLRAMVCNGELDLPAAQRELSRDWIAAYKKHFHAEHPLVDHAAFVKDRPWE